MIAALLSCRTVKDAAEQCHVSERSILRWLKEPEFQSEYQTAKSQLLESGVNRLRLGGFDAAERLHKVITDPAAPLTAVVSASGRLLDLLLKAVEIEDLSRRLDRLEQSVKESDQ